MSNINCKSQIQLTVIKSAGKRNNFSKNRGQEMASFYNILVCYKAFSKLIVCYKRKWYIIDAIKQSAYLVIYPTTIDHFACLLNWTPVGRGSGSMIAQT